MEQYPVISEQDIEAAARLRTVIHRLVKILRQETHGLGQLSLTERSVMGSLYRQGAMAPSTLAQLEKVTPQSMSQIINHLNELGLLEKAPSDEDKRKVMLSLTAAGRGYVEENRQRKQEWLAQALHEKLRAEDKDILMNALHILEKIIGD